MSSLALRLASAAVLLPLAIGALYAGGPVFDALLLLAAVLMALEWVRLVTTHGRPAATAVFAVAVSAVPAVAMFTTGAMPLLLAALAAAAGLVLILLIQKVNFFWYIIGFVWFFLPFTSLILLRDSAGVGFIGTLWILASVWVCDTMAYVSGRLIGGVKLAPRISPKKTWAGLLGGMAGAAILALAFDYAGMPGEGAALAVTGAFLALISQIGDLAESAVKRHFEVKDSGDLIPGHGGILDRVDGILFAAPAAGAIALLNDGALTLWQ